MPMEYLEKFSTHKIFLVNHNKSSKEKVGRRVGNSTNSCLSPKYDPFYLKGKAQRRIKGDNVSWVRASRRVFLDSPLPRGKTSL